MSEIACEAAAVLSVLSVLCVAGTPPNQLRVSSRLTRPDDSSPFPQNIHFLHPTPAHIQMLLSDLVSLMRLIAWRGAT